MFISSLKLKDKDFEAMLIVSAKSIKDPICGKSTQKHGLNYCGTINCEESELIYDFKTKYLGNFDHLKDVQPISFEKACKGKYVKILGCKIQDVSTMKNTDFKFANPNNKSGNPSFSRDAFTQKLHHQFY